MNTSEFMAVANRQARTQQDIEKLVELTGWRNDSRIAGFIQLANLSGDWGPLSRLLSMRLNNVENAHPFTEMPPAELVAGDIMVGYVVNPDWTLGCTVGLTREHLPTHIQIVGPSGKGKTILTKFLALQIHASGVPVMFADTEETFNDFPLYVTPGEALVFDVEKGEFKRNIWQPLPGETFLNAESRLRDIFREVWVGEGGINILSEVAIDLNKQHGIFTMSQFYERLKRMRSDRKLDWRRGQYLESLINRTSNLVNHLPDTYEVLEGFPLDELVRRSMVFRIPNLSTDLIVFFVIELLTAIADMKLRQGVSAPPLVAVLDEAQRWLVAAGYSGTVVGEPAILNLISTLRKRSTGLIVSTQLVSRLPDAVIGNTATQIYFQTLDGDSIVKIGRSLSLSKEQTDFLPEIPSRCALMRHPNFNKPFLVRIPDLNLEQVVSKERMDEIMSPILASLKWKPSPHIDVASDKSGTITHDKPKETPVHKTESQKHETVLLTKDESDYLIDIARTPFEPSTERDRRMKLSGYKGDDLRKSLAKRKMIEACKIRTGRRGGQVTLLETTGEGWEYLKSIKSGVEPPKGKGGFVHKYFQHAVKKFLDSEHGCESVIEDASSGKAVDVTAEIDGEQVAIEILVTGVTKEESNILSDVDAFGKTIVLVQDEKQLSELGEWVESELDEETRNKVEVWLVTNFLNQK